jgi:flagellar basal-body rod protein FlgF
MDAILTLAASGMQSRMQSLEMLANNLANVETSGFKADREFYSLYIGADASRDAATGDLSTQPVIESPWIDLAQGNLRNTSNPLDFAIDGPGMFAVNTPAGTRYTRNGSFRISATGVLTTSEGNPVRARGGGQISIPSTTRIDVLADGTIQQAGQPLGQIEMAAFDRDSLDKMGESYFAPFAGAVAKPATGTVVQGKLEQSNVTAAESAVRLVAIMRQFEMLQKAMNIGNDLNRHAIEEVARVAT